MDIQGTDQATEGQARSGAGLILVTLLVLSVLVWNFWGWIA